MMAEQKNFKWSSEPTAVLQIFGALISEPTVSVDQLKRQVQQVMIPVVRILSDGNQARDPQLGAQTALLPRLAPANLTGYTQMICKSWHESCRICSPRRSVQAK